MAAAESNFGSSEIVTTTCLVVSLGAITACICLAGLQLNIDAANKNKYIGFTDLIYLIFSGVAKTTSISFCDI